MDGHPGLLLSSREGDRTESRLQADSPSTIRLTRTFATVGRATCPRFCPLTLPNSSPSSSVERSGTIRRPTFRSWSGKEGESCGVTRSADPSPHLGQLVGGSRSPRDSPLIRPHGASVRTPRRNRAESARISGADVVLLAENLKRAPAESFQSDSSDALNLAGSRCLVGGPPAGHHLPSPLEGRSGVRWTNRATDVMTVRYDEAHALALVPEAK